MKNLNSYLSLGVFVLLISSFAFSARISHDSLISKIDSYLSHVKNDLKSNEAIIYSNFIVKEEGDFYTVDFMLTDKGKIEVLTKDFEDEYYILDQFSTKELKYNTVPVVSIIAQTNHKA